MIMINISSKQQKILVLFLSGNPLRSSQVHKTLEKLIEGFSLVTVKRELSKMATMGVIDIEGAGRSRAYRINIVGRIFADINAREYCLIEPDQRHGLDKFNFELFPKLPRGVFSIPELETLKSVTDEYKRRIADISATIHQKELERLIIELSWKSSKIEGNTYTLLDTEKLILENKEAPGHSKNEAAMILNHKDTFTYIRKHAGQFKKITRKNLEELHSILVKDLSVGLGFR